MALLDLQPLHRHGLRMKIIRRAQCSCVNRQAHSSENIGSKGASGLAQGGSEHHWPWASLVQRARHDLDPPSPRQCAMALWAFSGPACERSHTVHTLVLTVDLSRCSHVLTPTLVRCSYRCVLTPQMVYEHLLQITSNPHKSLKINRKSLKIAPILKIAQQNLLKTAQSPNEYYFPV